MHKSNQILRNLNYLQAVVTLTVLNASNDAQQHKVLYTWELYHVIINSQVQDLLFSGLLTRRGYSAVKLLQYFIANFNLK